MSSIDESAGKSILVVGAGFAGAVYARTLADHGYTVTVIDRRPHIAGNAYDEVLDNGIRVHKYGPHLFHTNNKRVVDWLSAFATLMPYDHKVEALLDDGRCVPLPVNRNTINQVFNIQLGDAREVEDFLQDQAVKGLKGSNAAEHLLANIGERLTDLFFRPYTRKMWNLELEDLDAAVVKRIPIRFDEEDRYFPNDVYQYLPEGGYTKLFERLLDSDRITVKLNTDFKHSMLDEYFHCFNSMPIDEFFDFDEGPLPYRSIRFHNKTVESDYQRGTTSVVNFTDAAPYTRETDWSMLPGHLVMDTGSKTITTEEPCDYADNNFERYYPIKTSDQRFEQLYQRYKQKAAQFGNVSFIGRCGTYQYLDMHQVINQSLMGVEGWITQDKDINSSTDHTL